MFELTPFLFAAVMASPLAVAGIVGLLSWIANRGTGE